MKRTTIVLPDDLAALLDWERRRRGVSAAEIVREALDVHLNRPTGPLPFVGIGRSGEHDVAERAEELLDQEWAIHLHEEMGRAAEEPSPVADPTPRRDHGEPIRNGGIGGASETVSSRVAPPRTEADGRANGHNAIPEDAGERS